MATCVPFQAQLSSIMEVLVKAAVMEISKLVDDKCAFLNLEISRKQSEIEMLRRKLLTTESRNAQLQRGFGDYMDRGADGGTSCPHPAGDVKFSEIEDTTVSFTIKEESPDDQIWISNTSGPVGGAVQYENAPERQHLEDERQLHHPEVSRLKSSDYGGMCNSISNTVDVHVQHLTVKMEKEDNHSGFNQDGCQHSAGKQTHPSAEFSMDDREQQLWSSIMEINQIDAGFPDFSSMVDEYSNTFPEHADHNVVSNDTKSNAGVSQTSTQCNGIYNGDFQKEVAPSSVFQSRAQVGLLQPERQREQHVFQQRNSLQVANMRQPNENSESSTMDKPQCQNSFTSGSYQTSTPQKPQSGAARGYVCSLCGKTYSFLHQFKMHQHDHKRKRAFWCAVCGKTFQCSSHLSIHHRTHTGEKPYSCGQCGKRFTQQSSLRVHQRAHSGERPYSCTQCGKTFILMHHLKRHRIVHS